MRKITTKYLVKGFIKTAGQRLGLGLALMTLLLVAAVQAPPAIASDGDGGTRSVFSLGGGSRAISLGRAFVSIADDATAVYWNPAALRNVQSKQIMGMYMPVFGDFTGADYTFFAAAYPTLNAGVLGFGFMRLGTTFDIYDASSRPGGEGDYSESQFIFAYAFERHSKWLLGSLATGVSFKIATQNITPYSSTSPGIDLGFRLIPDLARSLSLGVNFQDISGPRHRLFLETDQTYRTVMAGLGYTKVFTGGSALRLNVQMDMPEKADMELHVGAEYALSKYLAFRIGLDQNDFTFGLGVNVRGFGLDYAMLSKGGPGSSHPVSFTAYFGKTLYEQQTILAEERSREEEALIRQVFANRVQARRDQAKRHEAEGNYPQALDEWKIVIEYMPGDPEADSHIRDIQAELVRAQAVSNRDIGKQATISAHFTRGLAMYQENDYIRARGEWQAILDIDSTHTEARSYLVRTQEKIDDQIAAHLSRAVSLEAANRLTEAVSEWNHIQALDPGNRQADLAVRRMQQKIETQTQDLEAASERLRIMDLYRRALNSYNEGKYQEAIRDLEEILSKQSTHEEAKTLLARAQRRITPLTSEEEAEIRRIYLRGMQHFSKDRYAEAIAEWEKILRIDPNNESVQRNIEEARERLNQLENHR